jgi:hypothetical protein
MCVSFVTDDPGSKPDQKQAKITFEKLSRNLGLRAIRIPSCVQYMGTLRGCGLQDCWYCVYDSVCRAEGFGLLLAKYCYRIAALTPCKQKYPLKLSANINRTAFYV